MIHDKYHDPDDLFATSSEEIFQLLRYLTDEEESQRRGLFCPSSIGRFEETNRCALIQTILQRTFVSYQGLQLYWFHGLENSDEDDSDEDETEEIFLYQMVEDVRFIVFFYFSLSHFIS